VENRHYISKIEKLWEGKNVCGKSRGSLRRKLKASQNQPTYKLIPSSLTLEESEICLEVLHWSIIRHIPAQLKHYLDGFLPIFKPSTPITLAYQAVHWIQGFGAKLGLIFQLQKTTWPSTSLE